MGSPIKMNIKNPGPMAEYEGRHRNNVIWRADKMSKRFFCYMQFMPRFHYAN